MRGLVSKIKVYGTRGMTPRLTSGFHVHPPHRQTHPVHLCTHRDMHTHAQTYIKIKQVSESWKTEQKILTGQSGTLLSRKKKRKKNKKKKDRKQQQKIHIVFHIWIFFKKIRIVLFSVYEIFVCLCTWQHMLPGAFRGHKTASGPLTLDLQLEDTVWVLGTKPWVLSKSNHHS